MALLSQHREEQTETLFSLAPSFQIVRLSKAEALEWTDEMGVLKQLIHSSEGMYPSISRWFDEKVVPGLESGQRIAWVAFEGGRAIASAVLKLGGRAKFCHLRIDRDFQDMDLGQMFFSQMTLEARHDAKEIHFTLPESLWSNRSEFFESFGFTRATKSQRQYRRGDTELSCSAPFLTVWSSVMSRLPALAAKFSVGGYSLNNKILISIKPKYAGRILAGSKLFEVRKKFSNRWIGCKAVLYSSTPQRALVGEATVRAVTSGPPKDIWAQFGTSLGCSSAEFQAYAGSANRISAIELSDVIPYRESLSLAQMSHLVREDLRPPQSFCDLRLDDRENAWVKAVSVASLLHGRFGYNRAMQALGGR
jgi:predicted transcriptional regulator/N-acetylglutamate synthase-like GNAT family acetyltransferase